MRSFCIALLLAVALANDATIASQIANVQNLLDGACSSGAYDLTALSGQDYQGSDTGFTYKLRVCGTVSESNCAGKAGALCQYQNTAPYNFVHMLASWTGATWTAIDSSNPDKGVQVAFDNGDGCYNSGTTVPRQVTIQFACNPSGGNGGSYTLATTPSNPCAYTVNFPTAASCPGSSGGGGGGGGGNGPSNSKLSGGTIFIIILIVIIPVYIIAGCIYKRQKLGATGIESCPNIDFWRDLPSLVKDGFVFTWNKLRSCCGKGESGYDTVK